MCSIVVVEELAPDGVTQAAGGLHDPRDGFEAGIATAQYDVNPGNPGNAE